MTDGSKFETMSTWGKEGDTLKLDIDPKSHNIDPNLVEKEIKKNKGKIKALVAVDYAGHPCDWSSLKYLANKYKYKIKKK